MNHGKSIGISGVCGVVNQGSPSVIGFTSTGGGIIISGVFPIPGYGIVDSTGGVNVNGSCGGNCCSGSNAGGSNAGGSNAGESNVGGSNAGGNCCPGFISGGSCGF